MFCPTWGHAKDALLALVQYQNSRHVMFIVILGDGALEACAPLFSDVIWCLVRLCCPIRSCMARSVLCEESERFDQVRNGSDSEHAFET